MTITAKDVDHALLCYLVGGLVLEAGYAIALYKFRRRRRRRFPEEQGPSNQPFLRRVLLLDKPGDGLYAVHDFGMRTNAITHAFIFCFIAAPQLLVVCCCFYGKILAWLEGWSHFEGSDFVSYAVSLQANPIGNESLETPVGKTFGAAAAVFIFIAVNFVLGLTGTLTVVRIVARSLPTGIIHFDVLTLSIIAPLAVFAFCAVMSGFDAPINKHTFRKSFEGMLDWVTTGGNLGLVTPVDTNSLSDVLLRILVAMWSITFAGLVLGTVGSHPSCNDLVVFFEGSWDSEFDKQPEAKDQGDAAVASVSSEPIGQDLSLKKAQVSASTDKAAQQALFVDLTSNQAQEQLSKLQEQLAGMKAATAKAEEEMKRMEADRESTMPDVPDVNFGQENAVLQGRLHILQEENQALRSGVQALGENLEKMESSCGSIASDQGKPFRKIDSRNNARAMTPQIIQQAGDHGVISDLKQESRQIILAGDDPPELPPQLGPPLSLPEAKEVKVDIITFHSQQQKLPEAEQNLRDTEVRMQKAEADNALLRARLAEADSQKKNLEVQLTALQQGEVIKMGRFML